MVLGRTLANLMGFLAVLAAVGAAQAQVERSGGGESQKIMQQYQQLAAEKNSLQAQLAQMKQDLDATKADLAATKKERDALKAHAGDSTRSAAEIAQLTATKVSAERNLELYKQRMNELVTRFRETVATLREAEQDRNKAHKDLEDRNTAFDQCAENNLRLYEITADVLNRYEHVGLFTRVSASEPFTQITRTRIENLVDEYRTQAQANRTKGREQHP